jgi:hypothetical protein
MRHSGKKEPSSKQGRKEGGSPPLYYPPHPNPPSLLPFLPFQINWNREKWPHEIYPGYCVLSNLMGKIDITLVLVE